VVHMLRNNHNKDRKLKKNAGERRGRGRRIWFKHGPTRRTKEESDIIRAYGLPVFCCLV
jgi:hypothetical protein